MNEFEKKLQDELDYYKHELFSEQDLNEQLIEKNKRLKKEIKQLEKTLDRLCEVVVGRVNVDSGDGTSTLHYTKEQWKEWSKRDG